MAMDIDQDQNGMWKNIRDLEKKNQELREQLTKNKIELTEIREQKNMNENLAGHTQAMMDSLHTQVGELAKENQLLRMEREKNMQNTNQLGIISTMNSLEADLEGLRKNFEKSQEQINALQEDYGSYGAKSIITDAGIAQELQKLRARRDEAEAKVRAYESSETDLMNEILETSQKYEDLKNQAGIDLQNYATEIQKAMQQRDDLERARDDKQRASAELEAAYTELQKRFQILDQDHVKRIEVIRNLEAQSSNLTEENFAIRMEYERASQIYSQLKADYENQYLADRTGLEGEITRLQNLAQEAENQRNVASEARESLNAQFDALQSEYNAQKERYNVEIEKRAAEYSEAVRTGNTDLLSKLEKVEKERDMLRARNQEASEASIASQQRYDELEARYKTTQEAFQKIKTEFKEFKVIAAEDLARAKMETKTELIGLKYVENQLDDITKKYEEAVKALDKKTTEAQKLYREKIKLEKDHEDTREKYTQTKALNEEKDIKIATRDEELGSLRKEKSKHERHIDTLEKKAEDLEAKYNSLRESKKQATDALSVERQRIKDLQEEKDTINKKYEELRVITEELSSETARLRDSLPESSFAPPNFFDKGKSGQSVTLPTHSLEDEIEDEGSDKDELFFSDAEQSPGSRVPEVFNNLSESEDGEDGAHDHTKDSKIRIKYRDSSVQTDLGAEFQTPAIIPTFAEVSIQTEPQVWNSDVEVQTDPEPEHHDVLVQTEEPIVVSTSVQTESAPSFTVSTQTDTESTKSQISQTDVTGDIGKDTYTRHGKEVVTEYSYVYVFYMTAFSLTLYLTVRPLGGEHGFFSHILSEGTKRSIHLALFSIDKLLMAQGHYPG